MIKLQKIINSIPLAHNTKTTLRKTCCKSSLYNYYQQDLIKKEQDLNAMQISININQKINIIKFQNKKHQFFTFSQHFNIFSLKSAFFFSQSRDKAQRQQKLRLQQTKKKHGPQSDQYVSALQKIFEKHKIWNQKQEAVQCVQQLTTLYVKQFFNQKNISPQLYGMYEDTFTQIIDWLQNSNKFQLAIQVLKKLIKIQEKMHGENNIQILYEYDHMLELYSFIEDYDYEQILKVQKKMMQIAAIQNSSNSDEYQPQKLQFKRMMFGKFLQQYIMNGDNDSLIFALQKFDQVLNSKSFENHQFQQQRNLIENKTLMAFTCFKSYRIQKSLKVNQKALELLDLIDQTKYSQFVFDKRLQVCLNFLYIYSLKCEFRAAQRFIKICHELMKKISQKAYQRQYSLKCLQKLMKKKKNLPQNIIKLHQQIVTLLDNQIKKDYLLIQQKFNKIALQFHNLKTYPFLHYEQIKNTAFAIQHAQNAIEVLSQQKNQQYKIQEINQRINKYTERIMLQYYSIEDLKQKLIILNGTQQVLQFPDLVQTVQCLQIISGYISLFNFVQQQKKQEKHVFKQLLCKQLVSYDAMLKQLRQNEQFKDNLMSSNGFEDNKYNE